MISLISHMQRHGLNIVGQSQPRCWQRALAAPMGSVSVGAGVEIMGSSAARTCRMSALPSSSVSHTPARRGAAPPMIRTEHTGVPASCRVTSVGRHHGRINDTISTAPPRNTNCRVISVGRRHGLIHILPAPPRNTKCRLISVVRRHGLINISPVAPRKKLTPSPSIADAGAKVVPKESSATTSPPAAHTPRSSLMAHSSRRGARVADRFFLYQHYLEKLPSLNMKLRRPRWS
jgi:hypothetical protein